MSARAALHERKNTAAAAAAAALKGGRDTSGCACACVGGGWRVGGRVECGEAAICRWR